MKIAIVGIGGVGGYIGAKLCSLIGTQKKKYEITFIARGEHAQTVKTNGLRVLEDYGDEQYIRRIKDMKERMKARRKLQKMKKNKK